MNKEVEKAQQKIISFNEWMNKKPPELIEIIKEGATSIGMMHISDLQTLRLPEASQALVRKFAIRMFIYGYYMRDVQDQKEN